MKPAAVMKPGEAFLTQGPGRVEIIPPAVPYPEIIGLWRDFFRVIDKLTPVERTAFGETMTFLNRPMFKVEDCHGA